MSDTSLSEFTKKPAWPALVAAKRDAIRAAFQRPSTPEWVRRIEAAKHESEHVSHMLADHFVIGCADCEDRLDLWEQSQDAKENYEA